ncbi:MAG: LysM peptidoglycan-binding domain-containing protein [Anaerolineae bacterium]|jgi:LysM repeat protein|nr:LysM peptidoglycan-binding domain-containing protein [Chloroflexota bacterium]
MHNRVRRALAIGALLLIGTLAWALPVAADDDLATMVSYLERAWNRGEWSLALTILDELRAQYPNDEGVIERERRGRLNYAWELYSAGQCPAAYLQFERALGLLPGDPESLRGMELTRARCAADIPARPGVPESESARRRAGGSGGSSWTFGGLPLDYTVQAGDTLSGLATRFGVTVNEIRQANSLSGDMIWRGMVITIPKPKEPDGYVRYTVGQGDTLSSLARAYGTTTVAIQRLNRLQSEDLLVGQVLKIPQDADEGCHIVRQGETLFAIAHRYGVGFFTLMGANGLISPEVRAGEILRIPQAGGTATPAPAGRQHTVTYGETLSGLALAYNTTVAAIQQANGLETSTIYVGMVLTIP